MYRLHVEASTIEEFKSRILDLAAKFNTETSPQISVNVEHSLQNGQEPIAVKPPQKRGPKSKVEKKVIQEISTADIKSTVEMMAQHIEEPVQPEIVAVSRQHVKQALESVNQKKSFERMCELLGKYQSANGRQCQRLSELQEKDYSSLISDCAAEV